MRGLALAGAGALAAAALMAAAAPGPAAPAACSFDGATAIVELRGPSAARVLVTPAGRLLVDGRPCAEAATPELTLIAADGGPGRQRLALDLGGGGLGAVPIEAALGGDRDTLAVLGTSDPERHRAERSRLVLEGGARVDATGVNQLAVDAGGGADAITTAGWREPMRLSGGRGRDRLEGGRARDRVDGEGGDDRCDGGGATDALISCTPPFDGTSSPLDGELRERMTGRSWHRGCPVGLDELRLLVVPHWTMANRDVRTGRLVVHRGVDRQIMHVMRRLLANRFEIRRMHLIDRYGGDDHRSMNADNTSAFNCRFVAGTTRWSEHAFGRAIDVNPVENPYVSGGHVSPPSGRPYADRSRRAPGMVHRGDAAFRAFAGVGWEWGGDWRPARDYQHFSQRGR